MRQTLFVILAAVTLAPSGVAAQARCDITATIIIPGDSRGTARAPKYAYKLADGSVVFWGRFTIDADGSPHAYHPNSAAGLDDLGNAGKPGNWWALATDTVDASGRPTCQKQGKPIEQTAEDPAPGYYVAKTSMTDRRVADCRRQSGYVNSEAIPFVALPPAIAKYDYRANEGNLVVVRRRGRQDHQAAVFADQAPANGIGEGSILLAGRLGYNTSPRHGGTETREVLYLVLPAKISFPDGDQAVAAAGGDAFEKWGGSARLNACEAALESRPK